jgi:pilus assembly protein Flp/PilA
LQEHYQVMMLLVAGGVGRESDPHRSLTRRQATDDAEAGGDRETLVPLGGSSRRAVCAGATEWRRRDSIRLWVETLDPEPSVQGEDSMKRVLDFLKSEDGPTATEYAVMLALIIVVSIATIKLLGTRVNTMFGQVESTLDA